MNVTPPQAPQRNRYHHRHHRHHPQVARNLMRDYPNERVVEPIWAQDDDFLALDKE